MPQASEIVVCGASGYTGKLICESLHARGIPFTAAGRTEDKLRKALEIVAARASVPNIEADVLSAQHNQHCGLPVARSAGHRRGMATPYETMDKRLDSPHDTLQILCTSGTTGEKDVFAVIVANNTIKFDAAAIYAVCLEKLEASFVPSYLQLLHRIITNRT